MNPIVQIIEDGPPPPLEVLQKMVGGYVEMLTLEDGSQLIVNEEGLLKALPHNLGATLLAGRPIVGEAVLLKGKARLS